MNRVERRKIKKENKIRRVRSFFISILSFLFLIILLYIGLEIVDETNCTMMSMGDSSFLSYSKFDENSVKVIFCGDKYLVNVEKLDTLISELKEKTEYGIMNIKKFAHDKGKIVTKLVEDIF